MEYSYSDITDFNETGNNFTISNYTYDTATGTLKFNFTYSYEVYEEETVELTGKVNVIVYKNAGRR